MRQKAVKKLFFLWIKSLESHLSKFGLATKSQASGIQASAVSINMTWKSGKHSPLVSERLKALRFVQQQKVEQSMQEYTDTIAKLENDYVKNETEIAEYKNELAAYQTILQTLKRMAKRHLKQ